MTSGPTTADDDNAHSRRLAQLRQKGRKKASQKPEPAPQGELLPAAEPPPPATDATEQSVAQVAKGKAKGGRRKKDIANPQGDFFTPMLYDVGARDSRGVMDVAVFRLSKKDKRENAIIRYELPDGHVEVSSGPHGMASVWDYDIVLMAVSQLTEAMNQYRDGKGDKPSQIFRPHIAEVLKFCRKDNGGNQREAVVGALQRLSTTFVGIQRSHLVQGKLKKVNEGENLIGPFKTISNAKDKVEYIEIKIADWMYKEITEGTRPDVLTVHPDYFLRESGIARFIYRLARKAAGKDAAAWGFKTLYERSGSTGTQKEFNRSVRELVADDDLPEYALVEEEGREGPVLHMIHRSVADKWKEAPPAAQKPETGEGSSD